MNQQQTDLFGVVIPPTNPRSAIGHRENKDDSYNPELKCPHCKKWVSVDDCDSMGAGEGPDDIGCLFCANCGLEFRQSHKTR